MKLLTREDINAYGAAKNIILTPDAMNALLSDDPRKLLTEDDMRAKAATDKLFEMTVLARREKRDRMLKVDAEIAALTAQGKPTSHLTVENENADVMFQLVDYPQTREEALAFSKFGHSLNCVFEVEEVPAEEEVDDHDEKRKVIWQPETDTSGPTDDGAEGQQAEQAGEALRLAKSLCADRSALRQLAFVKTPFMDRREVVQTLDKEGQVQEKVRPSEEAYPAWLYWNFIDKYNQFYFQYLKFRAGVA